MNRYAPIGNAPGLGWDGYDDDGIDVQPLVDDLTRDDLRDLREAYRSHYSWKAYGQPPYGQRFGAWVRDRLCDMEMDRRSHTGDP